MRCPRSCHRLCGHALREPRRRSKAARRRLQVAIRRCAVAASRQLTFNCDCLSLSQESRLQLDSQKRGALHLEPRLFARLQSAPQCAGRSRGSSEDVVAPLFDRAWLKVHRTRAMIPRIEGWVLVLPPTPRTGAWSALNIASRRKRRFRPRSKTNHLCLEG
jgi:hypothetical protein